MILSNDQSGQPRVEKDNLTGISFFFEIINGRGIRVSPEIKNCFLETVLMTAIFVLEGNEIL
jgi:hypothetical protein